MKKLTHHALRIACAAALLALAGTASAANILLDTGVTAFPTSGTQTQLGRLVRNAIPQDFSGSETYPGTNNTTATFNYIVFTLTPDQLAGGPYVQVELDTQGLNLFIAAYANSYNPVSASNPNGNFQTNWLGDQGSSGDYSFTTLPITAVDPGFFGVYVTPGTTLQLVLATSGTVTNGVAAGAGTPYSLLVENFGDAAYGPLAAVPEPSSWAAMGISLIGVGWAVRRRTAQARA